MADHYVALNQGVQGLKPSDFITGTVSTAGTNQIEFRVQDGTTLSRMDIIKALEALEWFFESNQQVVAAGFQISG
jgi:hypothetical protein